jgi:hypothetical protein
MFGWLFGRARGRLIFRYHDGMRKRRADPIVIDRALKAACPDLDSLTVLLKPLPADLPGGLPEMFRKQAEANAEKALATIVAAVRAAFGVKPLGDDGSGLTEGECLDLLADFREFVNDLAEAARPLPSPPASSEPRPADSTTGASAACTSSAPTSTDASPA